MDHRGVSSALTAVVGGSGFIGRRLTARLVAAGRPVRVVDVSRPSDALGCDWVECDVRDEDGLRRALAGAGTVYNLAAARGTETHPWETYEALNVQGAKNVCRAATSCGVSRVVFTSTAAVYGRGDGPDEQSACEPSGGYGTSKLAAESVYRDWAEESSDRSLAIARPTVVFGPGDDGAGNRLIRVAAHPDFTLVGRGASTKSLAHVENVAAFLAFLGDRTGSFELFNYSDLPTMSFREIVTVVRDALDLAPAREFSVVRAYAASAYSSLARRAGVRRGVGMRGLWRAAGERRFDARLAHASGFVQPVDLHEALATTAQAEAGLAAFVHGVGRRERT